jgi:formate dehydrogenase maturation protein FdhE
MMRKYDLPALDCARCKGKAELEYEPMQTKVRVKCTTCGRCTEWILTRWQARERWAEMQEENE